MMDRAGRIRARRRRRAEPLAAVTAPLARRSVAKALEQDLIDLARAAERPTA